MTARNPWDFPIRLVAAVALIAATFTVILTGPPASAAPPANDDFAGAVAMDRVPPEEASGDSSEATKEAGEPAHAGNPGGRSVWYSWTAFDSLPVTIDTCGSGFDTLLGIYTGGSVDALTELAANDDSCGLGSSVTFNATAGTTYRIAVDGYNGVGGELVVSIDYADDARPPNDDFADAVELSEPLPITVTTSNVLATEEDGEPDHAGNPGGSSIWFRWAPIETVRVTAGICGASVWSLLAVYRGTSVDALTEVAADDGDCGDDGRVTFTAHAGTTYHLAVDGSFGATAGYVPLRIAAVPANDDHTAPQQLEGELPITADGDNTDASADTLPGAPAPPGNASVWFAWTAPSAETVTVATCGSSFDTALVVYRATADGGERVAANDDGCGTRSRVTIGVTAGTTYLIAVTGNAPQVGSFTLTVRQPNQPANDDFANATVIEGPPPAAQTGTNAEATAEAGEPAHADSPGLVSVWYRWAAETSGPVVLDTCRSDFDTLLAVYTGPDVAQLSPVASNDDACAVGSRVKFDAEAGQTYRIAVDGYGGATGTVRLRLARPPANDDIADAQVLTGPLPITVNGSIVDATVEEGEPQHPGLVNGAVGTHSVWYRWTPADSGVVVISSCTGVGSMLGIYTGGALDRLEPVPAQLAPCGPRIKAELEVVAGTTYWIAVDAQDIVQGPVTLTIREPNRPANDDFADAEVVPGSLPVSVTGSNNEATVEADEPQHGTFGTAGVSVWYRWTPTATGPVRVSSAPCEGRPPTVLAVYTGDRLDGLTQVAHGAGACGNPRLLEFTATAGTTYHLTVDSQSVPGGPFDLTLFSPPPAPANDDFADAEVVDGALPLTVSGTTRSATAEAGETGTRGSVWYSWTPGAGGVVSVDTCDGPPGESPIKVFTGDSVGALSEVTGTTADCGPGESVSFDAVAGTRYRIAVYGPEGFGGSFVLTLRTPNRPANDDLADADELSGTLPISAAGSTVDATREEGEPRHGDWPAGMSVWYRWNAPEAMRVAISTCGSDFDTLLGVYTGDSVDALSRVITNDDACGTEHGASRVVLDAAAGTTYLIAVDGAADAYDRWAPPRGSVALRVEQVDVPPNDHRSDAQPITGALPLEITGSTRGATREDGEPNHLARLGTASVWYRWTANTDQSVTLDACDADFRPVLAVYVGNSSGGLGGVTGVREVCGGGPGRTTFAPTPGTTYLIAVDGVRGDVGDFTLALRAPNRPPNDDFADAQELSGGLPISVEGTNVEASHQSGEPGHRENAWSSVWYSWTAAESGEVSVDTCGASFEAVVAVYTGPSVDALTERAQNGRGCSPGGRLTFPASAGVAYRIVVAGAAGAVGSFRLTLRAHHRPPNDDFADAEELSGALPVRVTGSNVDATAEPGEPLFATNSVWYRWTAPSTRRVVVETCGSSFDTALAVHTGLEVADLSRVGLNDNACGTGSRVTFVARPGETYYVQVYGAGGAAGDIDLRLREVAAPANDDFADAEELIGDPASVPGSNVDATVEAGEPSHGPAPVGNASVWYRWTAPADGRAIVDTCETDFETALAVYTGSSLTGLSRVASAARNCGPGSRVEFQAAAGTTYRIAVDGYFGGNGPAPGSGTFELAVRLAQPPANDDLVDAQVISGRLPISIEGTNRDASREPGEPFHAGFPGSTSVWYSWTAVASGPATVETCGTDFDTLLGVYTGPAVGSLSQVAADNNGCGAASRVSFPATAGTTYLVAVAGRDGASGPLTLRIDAPNPLAATTTEVAVDPSPASIDARATATATVSSDLGGTATGTVTFRVDGDTVGEPVTLEDGQAALVLPRLPAGEHTVTAAYAGDDAHRPSEGEVAHRVTKLATTTSVTASPNPATVGGEVTLEAVVAADGDSGATPTGTVTFRDGDTVLGTVPLSADGSAMLRATELAAGEREIVASYSGDADHRASEGALTLRVQQRATRTLAEPAVLILQQLRLTLRLAATLTDDEGAPLPGRTIRFEIRNRSVCTAVTGPDGRAVCEYRGLWLQAALSLGYVARFAGDDEHLPSSDRGWVIQ